MRYASAFDGIGAAHVAWQPLGWECAWHAEIDPFPSAVVAHQLGDRAGPNLGDVTAITQEQMDDLGPIDLLVGGSPCQAFSVAGLRAGMADPRGNLALVYLRLAAMARPRWIVWENVPGVLSSNGGRDFGAFLGALGQLGYGWAYRVLDAQYVRVQSHPRAVPQQRRRVFVVGCLGDWRAPAAVLLERESVQGHLEPSREAGESPAAAAPLGAHHGRHDLDNETYVAAIQERAVSDSDRSGPDGVGVRDTGAAYTLESRSTPQAVARCVSAGEGIRNVAATVDASYGKKWGLDNQHVNAGCPNFIIDKQGAVAFNWQSGGDCRIGGTNQRTDALQRCQVPAVAFAQNQRDEVRELPCAGALSGQPGMKQQTFVARETQVRRLTPLECERLQGFPDDWTLIPWRKGLAKDAPRYKAIGNSMAVNVMSWIGQRIAAVDALTPPDARSRRVLP